MTDDLIGKLSESDRHTLLDLKAEYERDGFAAFERLRDRDFMAYCRIVAAIMPEEFGKALEDTLSEAGLTYDDFQRIVREAKARLP
jgi:hypothetical protein